MQTEIWMEIGFEPLAQLPTQGKVVGPYGPSPSGTYFSLSQKPVRLAGSARAFEVVVIAQIVVGRIREVRRGAHRLVDPGHQHRRGHEHSEDARQQPVAANSHGRSPGPFVLLLHGPAGRMIAIVSSSGKAGGCTRRVARGQHVEGCVRGGLTHAQQGAPWVDMRVLLPLVSLTIPLARRHAVARASPAAGRPVSARCRAPPRLPTRKAANNTGTARDRPRYTGTPVGAPERRPLRRRGRYGRSPR